MSKHRDRHGRTRWMPKIVSNRPRRFNKGDGFDEARELLAAECERPVNPKAEEGLKRERIVSAALQSEFDAMVSRRACEIGCVISALFGAAAGFIACLVTH